jgi:putative redox protein
MTTAARGDENMAHVTVRLDGSYQTIVQARGHAWIADEPIKEGGSNTGPTPMEMLLGALGSCAAITARMYALRKGWPLESVDVSVSMRRFKKVDYPEYAGESDVVNELRQSISFHGPLSPEQKSRLLEIAGKCPVHRLLTQPNFLIEELGNPEVTLAE